MFPRAFSSPITRFAAPPTGHVVLSFSLVADGTNGRMGYMPWGLLSWRCAKQ